ncbi:3D domain-containing protein [Paradesulfitobacterium aromaticivorans]
MVLISGLISHLPTAREVVMAQPEPVLTTQAIEQKRPTQISRGAAEPPKREMIIQATAYTHTGQKTYTEIWPHRGTIAVDPKVIPLGSTIWVEGYGWGKAEDTGGAIKGQIIDLFMETEQEAVLWGRQNVRIVVIPLISKNHKEEF